jgi:hypothetical protein
MGTPNGEGGQKKANHTIYNTFKWNTVTPVLEANKNPKYSELAARYPASPSTLICASTFVAQLYELLLNCGNNEITHFQVRKQI